MRKILIALTVLLFAGLCFAQDFRAWHIVDEVMEDVETWFWNDGMISTASYPAANADFFVIMPYSSFTDKNGTRLAEGDDLKMPDGYTYVMVWNVDEQKWQKKKAGTNNLSDLGAFKEDVKQSEIVGDKYRNPGIENTRRTVENVKRIMDVWKDLTAEEQAQARDANAIIEAVYAAYQERQDNPE